MKAHKFNTSPNVLRQYNKMMTTKSMPHSILGDINNLMDDYAKATRFTPTARDLHGIDDTLLHILDNAELVGKTGLF